GATLSNVVVSDTLRSELRVDGVTTSAGTASVSGQTVTVSIPSLGAGQSVTVQITTTVLRNPSTPFFDNTATVSGSNGFAGSASASVPAVSGLPDTGYPPAGN